METKSRPASRIESVQILRGLAAAAVTLSHLSEELFHTSGVAQNPILPFIVAIGRGGVDVFFVISGFIMMYVSAHEFGAPAAPKNFMLKRLMRIVPVYWFYTSVMLAVVLIAPSFVREADTNIWYLLSAYLFIPATQPNSGEMQPLLELGWTLNYEMYFYAIFAASLFLPRRVGLGTLTIFFLAVIVAGFFIDRSAGALWFWTRPIIFQFCAGAILGWAFLRGVRIPGFGPFVLFVAGLLWFAAFYDHGTIGLTKCSFTAVCWVAAAIFAAPSTYKTSSFVWRFLLLLGDASYSLYLSHMFVIRGLSKALKPMAALPAYPAILALSAIAMSIGVALLSYRLIERPSNNWLRRRIFS